MDITLFNERINEIDSYIDLLETIEQAAQQGPPEISGDVVTVTQQKMLYAAVYLQLYNLVEATTSWCITAVVEATSDSGEWKASQLHPPLRREWIRAISKSHTILNADNRLSVNNDLCNVLLQGDAISGWVLEKGGGGNWDISSIEEISERIGCTLNISRGVETAAKRHFRDEKNSFVYIKDLRNKLAHGSISFEQSAENITVGDLKELKEITVNYLAEVVQSFSNYLSCSMYLLESERPARGTVE